MIGIKLEADIKLMTTTNISIHKTGFKYSTKNRAFETFCPTDNGAILGIPCGFCISMHNILIECFFEKISELRPYEAWNKRRTSPG
jgi:hypothetical protein